MQIKKVQIKQLSLNEHPFLSKILSNDSTSILPNLELLSEQQLKHLLQTETVHVVEQNTQLLQISINPILKAISTQPHVQNMYLIQCKHTFANEEDIQQFITDQALIKESLMISYIENIKHNISQRFSQARQFSTITLYSKKFLADIAGFHRSIFSRK